MPACGECIHFNKGFCQKGMVQGQIPPRHSSCERFEQTYRSIAEKAEYSRKKVSNDLDTCIYGLKEANPSVCSRCERYTMRLGSCTLIEKAMRK
ncbi:MAG: hypothetical protein NWF08_00170 [Candidatus Bathyarchaeota archaeon]|nr:hypothetical protein [Candidatus Bathyarchaeota archaeon]